MTTYHIFNDSGLSLHVEYDSIREARNFAREAYGTPIYVEQIE